MNQQNDPIVKLELPLSVINAALTGLGELPAKHALGPIQLIRDRVQDYLMNANKSAEPVPAASNEPPLPSAVVPTIVPTIVPAASNEPIVDPLTGGTETSAT